MPQKPLSEGSKFEIISGREGMPPQLVGYTCRTHTNHHFLNLFPPNSKPLIESCWMMYVSYSLGTAT